jgi:hypothetical protein
MCDLTRPLERESFTGWKIVAVERSTGKYYSVAMGFCYDDHEKVPIIKEQKQLSSYFISDILTCCAERKEMRGRTAVFARKVDALATARKMKEDFVAEGYRIEVKKAKVFGGLMGGSYGGESVVAGRHIKFLE